jgi:hypothetical protein
MQLFNSIKKWGFEGDISIVTSDTIYDTFLKRGVFNQFFDKNIGFSLDNSPTF